MVTAQIGQAPGKGRVGTLVDGRRPWRSRHREEAMKESKFPGKTARWAGATGLLIAGAIGGAVLAGGAAANAATLTASTSAPSSAASSETSTRAAYPAHGTAAHEALEKPVSGADATKAQAAAVKAVGSGTAGAVTTDVSGNGYEVTVTKSDGSKVEVHLDGSFGLAGHGRIGG